MRTYFGNQLVSLTNRSAMITASAFFLTLATTLAAYSPAACVSKNVNRNDYRGTDTTTPITAG